MPERGKGLLKLAGAAAGLGAAAVAQRVAVNRRRRNDPEAGEDFGERRGDRSRLIDVPDGARVFVEEVGPATGPGAIFVHGSALRTDVWHYQMAGLGGHRLVFCDLRGHGLSQPKGKAAYSMETLSQDLGHVIDECRLNETVIVGHSVGGMIALELCKRRPELMGGRVAGLVLVNTTYGPVTETLIGGGVGLARIERLSRGAIDAIGRGHAQIDRFRRLVRPSDAAFWAIALAAFGPKASAKQVDFTFEMVSETPAEIIFDLVRSYRDFDMTDDLGGITVPALVVGGTHDRLTMPDASERLAASLLKAELHIFEDCGHMSMLERHAEFNEMLGRFLNDQLGTKGRRRTSGRGR